MYLSLLLRAGAVSLRRGVGCPSGGKFTYLLTVPGFQRNVYDVRGFTLVVKVWLRNGMKRRENENNSDPDRMHIFGNAMVHYR